METAHKIIAYCDGGSRGNPGSAALGVFLPEGKREYSKFLGTTTNNVAEYQAMIFALKKIKQLIGGKKAGQTAVEIRSDSELLVSQLNGVYKIKEEGLIPFFIEIWNLKQDFKKVVFAHVPREENKEADAMVNRELDRQNGLF